MLVVFVIFVMIVVLLFFGMIVMQVMCNVLFDLLFVVLLVWVEVVKQNIIVIVLISSIWVVGWMLMVGMFVMVICMFGFYNGVIIVVSNGNMLLFGNDGWFIVGGVMFQVMLMSVL